jgi:hypothetical protein
MKLKVYNKKVIDFVWENMMASFFVAEAQSVNAPKNSVIICSHTKSITYEYFSHLLTQRGHRHNFKKILRHLPPIFVPLLTLKIFSITLTGFAKP